VILHQPKAIFFDAAGTLFTVNGSVGDIYARIARDYGKEVFAKDVEEGFRRCFADAPPMAFPGVSPERISSLEKQWWQDIVYNVFTPLGAFPQFSEYFDALFSYFARTVAWQLYPETVDTLVSLRKRGILLGVISNFDSRLFGLLDGFNITHFFDPIVISTHVGAAKPEKTIFLQALAHLKVHPEETFHVGDSLHADIEGASAVGILPVLVDRKSPTEHLTDYVRIHNLAELLHITDTMRTPS
jgi:putative hydrolase of the HAD superfamily